jgi:hypothetical protein
VAVEWFAVLARYQQRVVRVHVPGA